MDGPVGNMVKAQDRHGMWPAHTISWLAPPGYRELVTTLHLPDHPSGRDIGSEQSDRGT